MASVEKVKEWINEHVPMLAKVYENKYVGMAYDRFASLPPKQQRQVIYGGVLGGIGIIVLILSSSYLSLWYESRNADKAQLMINMIQNYQKHRRDKSVLIQDLERNSQLTPPGAFSKVITDQARNASISPRMVKVEEKDEGADKVDDTKGVHDVGMKQALIKMERVNLTQLKNFLQNIEFGPYNLSVSSIKIKNDDKIRGYMNVELGIVAYLFQGEEGG